MYLFTCHRCKVRQSALIVRERNGCALGLQAVSQVGLSAKNPLNTVRRVARLRHCLPQAWHNAHHCEQPDYLKKCQGSAPRKLKGTYTLRTYVRITRRGRRPPSPHQSVCRWYISEARQKTWKQRRYLDIMSYSLCPGSDTPSLGVHFPRLTYCLCCILYYGIQKLLPYE
jgi:hypothetical protein